MNVTEAIEGRHAVRVYDDRIVEESVIESLLRAAAHAPSATNERPIVFSVIPDRARVKRWSDRGKAMLLAQATVGGDRTAAARSAYRPRL